jgi:hypothetical protein
MDTSTNHEAGFKKTLLFLLTFVLWLVTVGLGFWAATAIREAVDVQLVAVIAQRIENQQMGTATGGGWRSIINYTTIGIGVLVWIGLIVIGGMEYHFKRVGERNSYRLFAWTIGIEIVIIVVSSLLLNV